MLVLVLNRHAFAFLVGRNLFHLLIVLGVARRIYRLLVVVRVFALIWLEDSLCGLLVMPEKLSVKVMPKRRLLYDKMSAQNSIFNSLGHILASQNSFRRNFIELPADSNKLVSVLKLSRRHKGQLPAGEEEKNGLTF